jgi:amidohydrolase
VVNDPSLVESVRAAAVAALGAPAVRHALRTKGGDSFAWFAERVPACYVRLGVHDPDSTEPRVDLHAGTFDVDERAIGVGVKVLLTGAARARGLT